jgi:hypothetical protein
LNEKTYGGKTLEELAELERAIPEGDWEWDEDEGEILNGDCGVARMHRHGSVLSVLQTEEQYSYAEARVLVASRNALPELIARVKELEQITTAGPWKVLDKTEVMRGEDCELLKRALASEARVKELEAVTEQIKKAFGVRLVKAKTEDEHSCQATLDDLQEGKKEGNP